MSRAATAAYTPNTVLKLLRVLMDLILTAIPREQTLSSKNAAGNTLSYLRSHREKNGWPGLGLSQLAATSVLGATSAVLEGRSMK